jgi:hypothetical protein
MIKPSSVYILLMPLEGIVQFLHAKKAGGTEYLIKQLAYQKLLLLSFHMHRHPFYICFTS